MNLQHFIEQQKKRGALDSSGRFTVNPYKAREKMARFQTGNPAAYLLRLVQAGVLSGSNCVKLQIGHRRVEALYFAPELDQLTPERVVSGFGEPLSKGNLTPEGYFMNALNLLFADPPESISIRWRFSDGRERSLTISEAGMEESHDSHEYEVPSLRVEVRRTDFDVARLADETRSIWDCCGCAPVPVYLDGTLVNGPNNPAGSLYRGKRPASWNDYLPQEFILAERILTEPSEENSTGMVVPNPHNDKAQHWRVGSADGRGSPWANVFLHDTPADFKVENKLAVADGLVVIPLQLQEESTLSFIQAGVVIQRRLAPGRGIHAWVCADGIPTDLTGFQLQENERSERLSEAVEKHMEELRQQVLDNLRHLNARYDWTPQRMANAGLTAFCLSAYAFSGWYFWAFTFGKLWAGGLATFGATGSAFTLQKRNTINEELRNGIRQRL